MEAIEDDPYISDDAIALLFVGGLASSIRLLLEGLPVTIPETADDTLFKAPGALFKAPGTLFKAPGALFKAPGTLFKAPGALFKTPGALFKAPNAGDRAEVGRGIGTRVRALESCESSAWTLSSSTEPPSPVLAPLEHNKSPITGNGTIDVIV